MKALSEDIKNRKFDKVYLLFGEEGYLVNQFKNKIKDALVTPGDTMNCSEYNGREVNITQIIDLAETMPFLAEKRVILITNSGLLKKGGDSLAEYIPSVPEDTCIVFAEAEVDKRTKLFKAIKKSGRVVEFKRLNDNDIAKWVGGRLRADNKKISREAWAVFYEKTGNDMNVIRTELEKLLCYCMDKDDISVEDVNDICSNQVSGKIFEMVDAIGNKNQKKALDLYYDLLELKEPAMRILALLGRHFRILMQLKEMQEDRLSYRQMSDYNLVPSFALRKYMDQLKCFNLEELKSAFSSAVELDDEIKSGKITDLLAVEIFIVRFSGQG